MTISSTKNRLLPRWSASSLAAIVRQPPDGARSARRALRVVSTRREVSAAIDPLRDIASIELEEVGAPPPEVGEREPGRGQGRGDRRGDIRGRRHDPQPLFVGVGLDAEDARDREHDGVDRRRQAVDRRPPARPCGPRRRRARRAARRRPACPPRRTRPGRTGTGPGPGCATRAGRSGRVPSRGAGAARAAPRHPQGRSRSSARRGSGRTGCLTSASAMPSRWRMPREYVPAFLSAASSSRTSWSSSSIRASASVRAMPLSLAV